MIQKFLNRIRLKGLRNIDSPNVLVVDDNGDIGINEDLGGDINAVQIQTDSGAGSKASDLDGIAEFSLLGGDGIDVTNSGTTITVAGETATDSNPGIVELATNAEVLAGTSLTKAITPAGLAQKHASVQSGLNYRIINTSFRQDINTTKYYLPLKSQDEQTALTREEVSELSVCDGRIVSVTFRAENLNTHTGDATITFGVEANTVGSAYNAGFSEVETESITVNDGDDHHLWHAVFSADKHWDSTDMWAVSMVSDTDISGSNERFFVTIVVEDDWSTYLAGSTREIDTTP